MLHFDSSSDVNWFANQYNCSDSAIGKAVVRHIGWNARFSLKVSFDKSDSIDDLMSEWMPRLEKGTAAGIN